MTRETTEEVTRKRWKQALDQLAQALLLTQTERERLLNSIGQQDPELRRTISQLLEAHSNSESASFMESPPWSYQPVESNPQSLVGKRLGAYKLTQYLAKGGMGLVYLAERADGFFDRQVAVKLMSRDLPPKEYRRFQREMRLLADLQHPNLVFLLDAGRMADGRPYLVMEYVAGDNLRSWIDGNGALPPEKVIEITRQICAGLQAAHNAGVIHRDIKPANIIVNDREGKLSVKVLDFGIAFRQQPFAYDTVLTEVGQPIGTYAYMSPEQVSGFKRSRITAASDLYSLGLVVYEMLTGQPAVTGNSVTEISDKIRYQTPVPPSQLRPDLKIPVAVDRVAMKALAKEPNLRYQNAQDFAIELESALHGVKKQSEKPRYAKAAAAVATAGVVIAASYFIWQREPVTNQQQQQIAASPSPIASPQPRTLRLLLKVENTKGEPLPGSSFALFNEGIKSVPARIGKDNALIISTDKQGRAETKEAEVMPGTYLMKAVRVGYKSIIDTITLSEDRARPGTVTLIVTLEPE